MQALIHPKLFLDLAPSFLADSATKRDVQIYVEHNTAYKTV